MAMGAFMGGATSYLGSIVGGKASAWISKWTDKLASPILKSWIPQAFGGSASGFTLSTGMSLLNGKSLETALKEGGKGAASGFAIGSLSGIAYGFKNAKSENVSPWTGNRENSKAQTDDTGTFTITPDGVVLPKNCEIPQFLKKNPHHKGSYGEMVNGKYKEVIRIDQGTPSGKKGPEVNHFHLNGGKEHIFDINL